ncbi:MAG TPA: PaaI family thioesterase [Acidimicrobiales bacterium]|nr:PaaI family thioesterase [Acidimicrobiales bacterium]
MSRPEADDRPGADDQSGEDDAEPPSGVSDFGISPLGTSIGGPRHPRRPGAPGAPSAEGVGEPERSRFAAAAALRRITAAIVGRPLPDSELAAAAGSLGALADRLEEQAGPGRRPRSQPDPGGPPQEFFPTSPVIGFANPLAPPVLVESADDGLRGSAFFDYQYEGPPTCVHGGVIALVFDELLGAANIAAGCPGMTGTLTVTYRRPTPLRTQLRVDARCVDRQGRKIRTWGGMFHDDELLAEAEGIFIELAPERFLRIIGFDAQAQG